MEIINSHIHLGNSWIIDSDYSEQSLIDDMDRNQISGMCILPLAEPKPDNVEAHNRIRRFIEAHPDRRLWGIADMHPRHDDETYKKEIRRCMVDLGFKAVKLHPLLHAVNPNAHCAKKAFDAAREYDVPIMIHTGLGVPSALPALVIPRAKEYADVKIVLCHAGGQIFAQEAMIVGQMFDNIYLEPSWVPSISLAGMFAAVGKERVVFGSDGACNTMTEIAKAESVGLSEEQKEWYFAKTAKALYKLD